MNIFGYITLFFALIISIHAIINLLLCIKPAARTNKQYGLVSILIPARNEAKVIERCVRSLIAQDYKNIEIIVYNDQSTDDTGSIMDRLAQEDSRIKVMHGDHLPAGWVGKCHGCHQMSVAAKGQWLLFGDSDIAMTTDAVARALATAEKHNVSFLSLFPRFDNYGFWEKAILPLFYFYLYAFMPIWAINKSKSINFVAANGSFILIDRQLYDQIGGHEVVKDKVLEDVLLARHIKGKGHKIIYGDGSSIYSAHMYDTLGGIWEGFSKNSFSFFKWDYFLAISFIVIGMTICLSPFILTVLQIGQGSTFFSLEAATATIYIVTMAIISLYVRQGLIGIIFFPISLFLSFAVIINSMYRVATGKGLTWKGRSYAK
jgi:glycosyltransferase involved in cell wall biosynthesis